MFYGKGLCEWVGSRFSPGRWILLYKESGILTIMETNTEKGKGEGELEDSHEHGCGCHTNESEWALASEKPHTGLMGYW